MYDPLIALSARRHGISDADILHAFHHPMYSVQLNRGLDAIVGPGRNGELLELGLSDAYEIPPVIVHAMPCRDWVLRKARRKRR